MRHEAEQRAQVRRRLAEDEARKVVEDARRDAEAFLAERLRRISELSDAVVERGEGIVMRLERAEEVRRQLQGLADALGESAEELARELGTDTPERRTEAKPPRLRPPTDIERPEAVAESAAGEETPVAESERLAAEAEALVAEAEAAAAQEEASATEEDASVAEAEASIDAELADDPTVGELAADAREDSEEPPLVPVELVPDEPEPARAASREPDEQLSARLVALQMAVAGGKRDEVETHLRRTFDLDDVTQILDDVFGSDDDDDGETAAWPTRGGAA